MPAEQGMLPIFRRVESPSRAESLSQVPVTLDADGHAAPAKWLGRKQRHFIVNNSRNPDAVVRREDLLVEVSDFEGEGPPVRLSLSYDARCQPGDEIRLVEAFANESDPQLHFHRRLKFWVEDFGQRNHGSFVDNFTPLAHELRRELKERAARDFGLTLRLRVRIDGAERLSTIEIGPLTLPIRIRGVANKLDLQLEMELAVDPDAIPRAVRHLERLPRLKDELLAEISGFFTSQVTLHQYAYQLAGQVAPALEARLHPLARAQGRLLSRLHLQPGSPLPGVLTSLETTHSFECELAEYPVLVEVKSRFWLELYDVGKYTAAGSPALREWAAKRIEDTSRSLLFGIRYTELMRQLEEKKNEVKHRMELEARNIGYTIKQLITLTSLQADVLREPFTLQVNDQFPTAVSQVEAGLEIVVNTRINEIDRVEDLLNRQRDVKEVMRAAIREHVANMLHAVDPETFYLYFKIHSPPKTENGRREEPLERRIRREISKMLQDRFGAEDVHISLKQTETNITELIHSTLSTTREFSIVVMPRHASRLPIPFKGTLAVTAIDPRGWRNFLKNRPTMDTIENTVKRALETRLGEHENPDELYQFSTLKMVKLINAWASQRLGEEFGLCIEIRDWSRGYTLEDEMRGDALIKLTEARAADLLKDIEDQTERQNIQRELGLKSVRGLLDEYTSLQDALKKGSDYEQEDRAHFQRRIAEIEKRIDSNRRSDGEAHARVLEQLGAGAYSAGRPNPRGQDGSTTRKLLSLEEQVALLEDPGVRGPR